MTHELGAFYKDSPEWARSTPSGWARLINQLRWDRTVHLALVEEHLLKLYSGEIENLILTMPPRHGKSMLTTEAFPGWWMGKRPHDEVVITSYEATLAQKFGRTVRDSITEYGDLFNLDVDPTKKASGDWRLTGFDADGLRVTGGLRAIGVDGGISGRGGDLIIIDDPIKNAKQAQSLAWRKTVWEWYLSTLFTRRGPNARQLVVMTRWHDDDLVGRLLDESGEGGQGEGMGQEWTVLNLPAICDSEDDPLGREIGEPLWPSRWPLEKMIEIKGTQTPYWWSAMYQGRPAPASGNIYKRGWWKFWQPPGAKLGPVRIRAGDEGEIVRKPIDLPTMEDTVSSWDLSFTKGAGTSFVAGQKWGKAGGSAFLLDQTRERRDYPETIRAFRAFHVLHADIGGKWVENKANGPALISLLQPEIPGILPVEPEGTKEERARAVAYFAESGNVYLPHPAIAPWVWEFIEEHAAFPNAVNDDQVDTGSQALKKLFTEDHLPGMLWGRRHSA